MTALSAKDPATSEHSERCSWYTAELARELGLSDADVETLRLAALLHDLGKLVTPDEILRKPGPLDKDETASMRQHPIHGMSMLTQIDAAAQAIPTILHHHEHFDGSGYPDGLAGDEIPIASRILLVTDAFDAMTTDRPYRKAMPEEAAIQELRRCSGSQFDPHIVEAFLRVISRTGAHPLRASAATDKVTAGSLGGS
jgi:putative nucleotidyltransferase with HDIG domain